LVSLAFANSPHAAYILLVVSVLGGGLALTIVFSAPLRIRSTRKQRKKTAAQTTVEQACDEFLASTLV